MSGATTDPFSIATHTSPGQPCATIVLSGELDIAAREQLDGAVQQLADARPGMVIVDVAAVTFVGSDLPNFLLNIRQSLPAETVLVVSQPSPSTAWVLHLTEMTKVVDLCFA